MEITLEIAGLAGSRIVRSFSGFVNQLIITGGKGGLGQAIAAAFVGPDWEIDAPGRSRLDVTDGTAIKRYFFGRQVDLLVCAAGITRDARLSGITELAWDDLVATNFGGAASCAAAAIAGMLERQTGHIIFISSNSAVHPPIGQVPYATAKASLLGLTRSLSSRLGSRGIRVNAILPGFLETGMTESVTATRRRQILADHQLGRFNTPAAVAGFIHFLHHQLRHTSGQVFQLDSRTPE